MVQLDALALRGAIPRTVASVGRCRRALRVLGVGLLWISLLTGAGSAARAECECETAPCPCRQVARYSTDLDLATLSHEHRASLIVIFDGVYLCPCAARVYGGVLEKREYGVVSRGGELGQITEPHEDGEGREVFGIVERREYGREVEQREFGWVSGLRVRCCTDVEQIARYLSVPDGNRIPVFDGLSLQEVEPLLFEQEESLE